jgi:hypothetical protein
MTYPEPKEDRDALTRRAAKLTTPTNNGITHSGSFGPAAEMAARARDAEPTRPPKPAEFPPSAISVWGRLVESWRTYGRTLPTDSAFRKEFPIESGVNMYFPAALVCCAAWSKFNNNKHNPGEPLHHSRAKSGDHEECISRHSFDIADAVRRGDELTELEEATAVFWRAGARLQILCERLGAPLAPAARLPEGGSK